MLIRALLLLCTLLTFATPAAAQLGSVPNTFSAGTTISSSAMNANFAPIFANALNRTAGVLTGPLTSLAIFPTADNVSDIGSAALSYNDAWFDGTVTIGTLAVTTLAADLPITEGGTGSSSASAARTALGLAIGTDVQAFNTNLTGINQSLVSGAAPVFAGTNFTGVALLASANAFTNAQTVTRTSGEQFNFNYDANNRMSVEVNSAGVAIFNAFSSGTAFFRFDDIVAMPTLSGVFGPEGGSVGFVIDADESDDAGDRWTFTATDGSTAGTLTLTHAGSTFLADFSITNVDDVVFTAGEATGMDLNLLADDGDDAADRWILRADTTNSLQFINDATSVMSLTATTVTIPYLASSSGTRFVCSDTAGTLTDSASACSGTDPDALALEVAELRTTLAALVAAQPAAARWSAPATQAPKAPYFISSNANTVPAGNGLGFWFQLATAGSTCDQANPIANDFVAFYACMESTPYRRTATGAVGLYGANYVLTATNANNISMVGIEVDIQSISNEGVNVPEAWATNGKVGLGAVLASNGATTGDGSAGVSVTVNGTDLGDLWRYGVEASGVRTASFYARKNTNIGAVSPAVAFFNDTDSAHFLRTVGTHVKVLDSNTVDIYGSADGRIDIDGLNPVMNMRESDQPLNGKFWRYQVAGGDFTIETVNDAYTSAARVLALRRNGEVNVPNLAGAGDRAVCASADGTLIVCGGNVGAR